MEATTVDRDKAKQEMGAWIADYFDDAGYIGWEKQCQAYKSMLMTAFPPIDPLDDVTPDFGSMPIDKFEGNVLKFLEVMDGHMATEQRRIKPKFTIGTVIAMLKRQ